MAQETTPRALGFRMPAEWARHEATWLAWPHNREDWPGKFAPIAWVYAEIVARLSRVERVRILIGRGAREKAAEQLRKTGTRLDAVEFIECATNRSWTRDYCPLFVTNDGGEVAATKWRFNGWAKYRNWQSDDAAFDTVESSLGGIRTWRTDVVLEGGAIDVNGEGLMLATEECLLSAVQERNPGLGRKGIEQAASEYLGVDKVLWFERGIAGDDTHGHIDDLARFAGPRTIVLAAESDPAEENYGLLRDNLERARHMTDQHGQPLEVVTLPMPRPVFFDGQRLPASYLNFYIANGLVLVPTFNDLNDRVALNTLAELFPGREVTGIYCGDLVLGLGTLHCMTMQQPAGR